MGRHGHLDLNETVQQRLLAMNAARMDRALVDTGIGIDPFRILLANALAQAGAAMRRTKADFRVCAGLWSAIQSATRPRLIAAAVRTCWRWVLAAPM